MVRLLLLDNPVAGNSTLKELLTADGFDVDHFSTTNRGIQGLDPPEYSLVILDLESLHPDGYNLMRHIRQATEIPVLVLAHVHDPIDRVIILEIGADDFLEKPFFPREALARIRAILRRSRDCPAPEMKNKNAKLSAGNITLSRREWTVCCDKRKLELTCLKFNLLALLLERAGEIVARRDVSEVVFGRRYDPCDRSLDNHICNLRKKVGKNSDGTERIKTIRGRGYLYSVDSSI